MDLGLARRISTAYGIGTPATPPGIAARGEQGRIWRLTTDAGTFALKELWIRQEEDAALADVAFQRLALEGGLPMPAPIERRDGAILTELDDGDGQPLQVRLYDWVELAKPDRPAPIEVGGALLGRLHALERPAGGDLHWWFRDPLGADGWGELTDAVHTADPPWLTTLEACLPAAIEGEAIVVDAGLGSRPSSTRRRCHLDFNVDNVLLDPAGGAVILDWENSGPAPDDGELGAAATDFAPGTEGAVRFVRAYRAAGGVARIADPSSFALAIAVQNHLIAFYARRALAPATSDEDRRRSAWRLGQIADNLLTLDRVDELVRALRAL